MSESANATPEMKTNTPLSLGGILSDHGMFCLHGIAGADLGLNNAVPSSLSLKERFRIVIGSLPEISTAIYRKDCLGNQTSLWGNIGIILRDGDLQFANRFDAGTTVSGGRRNIATQSEEERLSIIGEIDIWQQSHGKLSVLNEVVVSDPKIAGLYFKDTSGLSPRQINRDQTTAQPNHIPKIISELAEELDLPVYAIRTTGVYEIIRSDESGRYNFLTDAIKSEPHFG